MQRQRQVRPDTLSSNQPPLEVLLDKSDDEELFYTASLHFLQQRLQEKHSNPQETSQSCCDIIASANKSQRLCLQRKISKLNVNREDLEADTRMLTMHEVLPFPKSKKDGLITKIKNTLRLRRSNATAGDDTSEGSEPPATISSNFKFPRCERLKKGQNSSCLFQITEDESKEGVNKSKRKSSIAFSSTLIDTYT